MRHTIILFFVGLIFSEFASGGVENSRPLNNALMSGLASIYDRSSGEQTASGEPLREESMTAAHPSLPFGTVVEVSNNRNGRKTLVRVNDRGPFARGRVIDLTPAAGRVLGFSGITDVSLAIVSAADTKK
jgi:rare lipoprotein A